MSKIILVIEDDGDLCTLLDYNLSRSGYRVELLHRLEGGWSTLKSYGRT